MACTPSMLAIQYRFLSWQPRIRPGAAVLAWSGVRKIHAANGAFSGWDSLGRAFSLVLLEVLCLPKTSNRPHRDPPADIHVLPEAQSTCMVPIFNQCVSNANLPPYPQAEYWHHTGTTCPPLGNLVCLKEIRKGEFLVRHRLSSHLLRYRSWVSAVTPLR